MGSIPGRLNLLAIEDRIARKAPPQTMDVRVVAVDGHGGAGKTTLAARLAVALGDAPAVHPDDFASWDHPLDWWPRLIEQVLQPRLPNASKLGIRATTGRVRGSPSGSTLHPRRFSYSKA